MESKSCKYYVYIADFGDLIKVGVTHDVDARLKQVSYKLSRKVLAHSFYEFPCIDDAEFIESLLKYEFKDYSASGEAIKTEIFSLSFDFANSIARGFIDKGVFGVAKNPRGAGRNKNTWTSRKMTVPDPIRSEVKELIDSWIKENK